MKKIVKSFILVAAAAMGFTACQKEIQEEVPADKGTVQVTFVADSPETKTSVDTSDDETPFFSWDESETFAVLEQTDKLAAASSVAYEKVDGKANITATFASNAGKGSYNYVTVYPAGGYVNAESIGAATLSLPAVQTMAEGSYDPDADLMVSRVVTADAQPTEAQMVGFTRLAAVVKMTLNNFSLEAGDEVEQVIFTAAGKNLAGTVTADLNDPHAFTVAEGVDNVTVNTTSASDVYFTVLPTTLVKGDEYTVTVITNEKLYVKTGTIGEGKTLSFEAGMVTRFGVNMEGIAASEKWVLVKDASTLKEGDVVAIVAKDYDKALSTKLYNNASETSTSAKRGLADVAKIDNYLIGGEDLQQLTLVTGTVDGTFSFYDEVRGKFLVSSSKSSTCLVNQVYCDVNTSFKITIDGATTAATITNTEGEYKNNLLRYNSNGYFVSNQNNHTTYKDVCIYRLEGTIGTIPVVDANVTVPSASTELVIAEEGAAEPTAISEVVFNYVGDWTITPSTEAQWLNVAYDATMNCLTYTAEANTGAKREAVVTITASLEGHESLSWTFNVVQKGAPEVITIADFRTKKQDFNTTYQLTGIVTAIATTYSTWTIEDGNGNQAKIKYFKTEDGEWVSSDINLEVGDVVTVNVVITGTDGTKESGSSTYPSIYKGHYNVSATVTPAVVGYEGGDATVAVAVNAYYNAVAPSTIEATIEESDFAELTYAGGSTATVSLDENTGGSRDVDVTFTCGLATSTVTIAQQNHPSVKVGWFLVTDASELKSGDKVIIAANEGNNVLAVGSSSTSAITLPSVTITKSGNEITGVSDSVTQFTLSEGLKENEFAFNFAKGTTGYYLCAPNTKEQLKIKDGDLMYYGSWTIAIDDQTGAATISTIYGTATTTPKEMRYNASSTKFITIQTGASDPKDPICLYKYYN